jgi:hypothetical protein
MKVAVMSRGISWCKRFAGWYIWIRGEDESCLWRKKKFCADGLGKKTNQTNHLSLEKIP